MSPPTGAGPDPARAAAVFVVRHLTGSRRGTEDRFDGGNVGIGRGRSNRLALDPELDRTVSARHAEIRLEDGALVLYDLGSLNGTYVNGRRVRRAALGDGDEIGLGREGPRLKICRHGDDGAVMQTQAGAREASRGGPFEHGAGRRRGRRTRLVLGLIVVVLSAAGAVILWRGLAERVRRLEGGVGRDVADAGGAARVQGSSVMQLRGLASTDVGLALEADLGAGVLVGRRQVATCEAVLDDLRLFVEGRPGARIVARPEGATAGAEVAGFRRGPSIAAATAAVVLELAADAAADPAAPRRALPARSMSVRRSGFPAEKVEAEEYVGSDGARAVDPATAPLIRLSRPAGAAGAPLFDAEGGWCGLLAGPARPGLALSAAAVREVLALSETAAAEPLRR